MSLGTSRVVSEVSRGTTGSPRDDYLGLMRAGPSEQVFVNAGRSVSFVATSTEMNIKLTLLFPV